jgi:hypothetical protein
MATAWCSRRHGKRQDGTVPLRQFLNDLAGFDVEDRRRAIERTKRQVLAVRQGGQHVDAPAMPVDGAFFLRRRSAATCEWCRRFRW